MKRLARLALVLAAFLPAAASAQSHRLFSTTRDVMAALNYPGVVICDPTNAANCATVNTSGQLNVSGTGGGSSGSVTAAGVNGSLAQAVQGITGGVPIAITGSFSSSYPYQMTSGQAATSASAVGIAGIFNTTPPTLTNTQVGALQLDNLGNLKVNVVVGGSSSYPYSMSGSGVTATAASGAGQLCTYNSSPITTTSGFAAPCQADVNGYQKVDLAVGTVTTSFPYSMTAGQTAVANSAAGQACAFNTTPPTLTSGQVGACQATNAGSEIVHVDNAVVNPQNVVVQAATSGGATHYFFSGLGTTVQCLKNTSGNLYGFGIENTGGTAAFIQFFDVATAGSVTLGTTQPNSVQFVGANGAAFLDELAPTIAWSFNNGMCMAATTTATGSTAAAATIYVKALYK
jgi:hypothetical protein